MTKHKPCPDPFCMDCRCAVLEVEIARLLGIVQQVAEAPCVCHPMNKAEGSICLGDAARAALEHADGA